MTYRSFSKAEWDKYNEEHQFHHENERKVNRRHPQGPCWQHCEVCAPDFKVRIIYGR